MAVLTVNVISIYCRDISFLQQKNEKDLAIEQILLNARGQLLVTIFSSFFIM